MATGQLPTTLPFSLRLIWRLPRSSTISRLIVAGRTVVLGASAPGLGAEVGGVASGAISGLDQALELVEAGASRPGTSRGVALAQAQKS